MVSPADDLASVVCMVYETLCPASYEAIHGIQDPLILLRFWKEVLAPSPWQEMVHAAKAYDHQQLKQCIQQAMPQRAPHV